MRACVLSVAMLALAPSAPASAQSYYQTCDGYDRSLSYVDGDITAELLMHPFEAAALVGTLAGLSAFVDRNLSSDDKNMLMGIGAAGALYCLWDENQAASCARTASRLTSLFSRRGQLMQSFNSYSCWQYFKR